MTNYLIMMLMKKERRRGLNEAGGQDPPPTPTTSWTAASITSPPQGETHTSSNLRSPTVLQHGQREGARQAADRVGQAAQGWANYLSHPHFISLSA